MLCRLGLSRHTFVARRSSNTSTTLPQSSMAAMADATPVDKSRPAGVSLAQPGYGADSVERYRHMAPWNLHHPRGAIQPHVALVAELR